MDVLIPIEISKRELLYKLVLCNYLASHGFNCFLGTKSNINLLISKFRNFLYIDKGYHMDNSEKIYEKIKINNGIIISLDEEGAVDFKDGSTLKNRYSKILFKFSQLVFFWGKYQNDLVIDNNESNTNCIISGHPRFELLKKEYNFLYDQNVKSINKNYDKFILINTNMSFGNNIRGDEFIINNYSKRFKNIESLIKNDKIKIKYFTYLIKKLINKNFKVVIRPHPEENEETYKKILYGFKNFYVSKEYSSIPWILASKVMIHSDCTTGVEAYMLGKKSISFMHNKFDKDYLTVLPQKCSFVIDNDDEIIDFIYKDKFKLKNNKIVKELYDCFNFNKNPFTIIVNSIKKIIGSNAHITNHSNKLPLIKLQYQIFRKNVFKFFTGQDKLYLTKLEGFNKSNVEYHQNHIIKINKNFKNNKIEKVVDDLFLIKKK
tara:strand:+ start:233 stop:1531 length:1299 start_codon:yes stop_codon:yes gene_type:complete